MMEISIIGSLSDDLAIFLSKILPRISDIKLRKKIFLLKRGVNHKNYMLEFNNQKIVVRENISENRFSALNYEFMILKNLRNTGVTPEAFGILSFNAKINKRVHYFIEEFIEGKQFSYKNDYLKVAYSLSKVHKNKIKYQENRSACNPIVELYKDIINIFEKINGSFGPVRRILDLVKKYEGNLSAFNPIYNCLVHTDLNAGNFIVKNDICYIIDWETSKFSSIEWDIGHFLAKTTTLWDKKIKHVFLKKEKDRFIKTYAGLMKIDEEHLRYNIDLILPFIYLRCFAWTIKYYLSIKSNMNPIANLFIDENFINHCVEKI